MSLCPYGKGSVTACERCLAPNSASNRGAAVQDVHPMQAKCCKPAGCSSRSISLTPGYTASWYPQRVTGAPSCQAVQPGTVLLKPVLQTGLSTVSNGKYVLMLLVAAVAAACQARDTAAQLVRRCCRGTSCNTFSKISVG